MEARLFTAHPLVRRLRRAHNEGRLECEAALIGRVGLLMINDLGFQVFAGAYERQLVVITTNLELSR